MGADLRVAALHLDEPTDARRSKARAPMPPPELATTVHARPTVLVREELGEVTSEAMVALLADPDIGVYVRAHRLVRVVRDEGTPHGGLRRPAGAPIVEHLSLDALRSRLDHAAEWVRHDMRSHTERRVLPPEWVARNIAAMDNWPFANLEGVVETPIIRPDGELITHAGYDAATGLLHMPSENFPTIPVCPTATDVHTAVELLREPFHDFPFLAECDRTAALSAVLTLTARHAIRGPVPMFAVRGRAPGTGKNMLVDVVSITGTGRVAARMTMPRDDAELRKVILTVALEAAPLVLLDNVDRPLGSASLSAALTADEWEDRLLGVSARVRAPLRAMWLVTGNNVVFVGDLGRRVVPVDLDARLEHPEDRTGFRHSDLLAWVREHRGELVAAALTVLRAYYVAGRPAHGCGPRKGSFEAWDDTIRGACVWAQVGDPLEGSERIRREDDSDIAALRAALVAWIEAFGRTPRTVAQVVSEALRRAESDHRRDATLRDALLGLTARDKLDTRTLGYALRRVRGRIANGRWFEVAGSRHASVTAWAAHGELEEMERMEGMVSTDVGADGRDQAGRAGTIPCVPSIPSGASGSVAAETLAASAMTPTAAVAPDSKPRTGKGEG